MGRQLDFTGELPRPAPIDRLAVDTAILGTNLSRSPAQGEIAGGFSSSPPGHWTTVKLFLAEGTGEVFLDISPQDKLGEFSLKDSDYATIVVTELAKVLLPRGR